MSIFCTTHSAYVYDRGGLTRIGVLDRLELVRWERLRDDVSSATVWVSSFSEECVRTLGLIATGRSELVIFRGDERVWEGPITHVARTRSRVEIQAKDVMHYVYRTAMIAEYDNTYPNVVSVLTRVNNILTAELARKEALNPPINVLPHVVYHSFPATDAKTSAHTLPYESTVFSHIDTLAARGGLDYVAVGRSLHFFDVDTPLGKTPTLTDADFIGDVIVTEYGMELATWVAVTDGEGNAGIAGSTDAFYGLVEFVHLAYDEGTGPGATEEDPPTVAEMQSQAARILSPLNPVPVVVRVPDNSTLNPNGSLRVTDLVPGVWMPVQAVLPGRNLSQWQKLDRVVVQEGAGDGETITVTLSPAPHGGVEQV